VKRSRLSTGSLRKVATRQLETPSLVSLVRSKIRNALWAEESAAPTYVVAATALGLALLLSIVFTSWTPSVLPARAPDDPAATMMAMWQVHAAVVALAVPLLVLLIEQARSRAVIATSAGPALVSRSAIVFTTAFSLGAVIEIGVVTLYFQSDGAVLTSFLVACLSVLLIIWAYASALSLLLSPTRLRAQSLRLLERRLRASMMQAFIEDRMNQILMEGLAPWAARHPRLEDQDLARSPAWSCAIASRPGRVVDVDIRTMLALLRRFVPLGTAHVSSQPNPDALRAGSDQVETRLVVRPIGDRIHTGDVLLAIAEVSYDELPLDALASVYTIE
jgi:hypothetical protein